MATTKKTPNTETDLMNQKEIPVQPGELMMMPPAPTFKSMAPATLIEAAVANKAPVQELRDLFELQKEWEANEARKAYVAALSQFKMTVPELPKESKVRYENKDGSVTEYYFCSLATMAKVLGEALSKVGLSFTWNSSQGEGGVITVTCTLTHVLGHSESTSLWASPDQSGGKNNIQAVGSTQSYLQRYTLRSITGVAEMDQLDDDGMRSGPKPAEPEFINVEQIETLEGLIKQYDMPQDKILEWVGTKTGQPTLESIRKEQYGSVHKALVRKGKLMKEPASTEKGENDPS